MKTVTQIIITLIALAFITTTRAEEAVPKATAPKAPAAGVKVALPKGPAKKATSTRATKATTRVAAKSPVKTSAKTPAKTPAKTDLDLTPTQEEQLLALLNKGSSEDLGTISGIATTRAGSIVSARPFQNVHEVNLVPGVGDATFERILKHGKTLARAAAKPTKS